jgi:hypothetical protein
LNQPEHFARASTDGGRDLFHILRLAWLFEQILGGHRDVIERIPQVMTYDGQEFFPGSKGGLGFAVALLFPGQQVSGRPGGGLMMSPAHFGGGIRPESFGVDGNVRGFSFDAQSFVSFSLAFRAGPAYVGPSEIARSVGVATTLPFGFVGHHAFRIPIDVCLVLRSRFRIALSRRFFPGSHLLCLDVRRENAFIIAMVNACGKLSVEAKIEML